LILRARQGDLEAFNGLVLRYQDSVFQYAVWMLGKPEAAEEVTQESFILAYRKLHSFQDSEFCCWLLKIAHHLCQDELRHRIKDHSRCEFVGDTYQDELEKIVQEALNELPLDLRSVIILVDLQGMDYTQAAEILSISPETLKRRLARARVHIYDGLHASRRECA